MSTSIVAQPDKSPCAVPAGRPGEYLASRPAVPLRGSGLHRGGPAPEQVPLAALAADGICAGIAVAAGRAVTRRAGGAGAGGLALANPRGRASRARW